MSLSPRSARSRAGLCLALTLVFAANLLLLLFVQTAQAATYGQGSTGETVRSKSMSPLDAERNSP